MEDTHPYLAVSRDGKLSVICECDTKFCGHHVSHMEQYRLPPHNVIFIVADFDIPDFIELRNEQ